MRRWSQSTIGLLLVACLLGVLVITVAPYAWDLNRMTVELYVFFRTHFPGTPAWLTPEDYGRLLNVLLFVPVGMVLAWWLEEWWVWAVPIALCFSVAIELVQRVPTLERESSFGDVVCNGAGAVLGAAVVALLRARPRE